MSLAIQCPHCSLATTDVWDVLDEDTVHEMTCQFCKKKFAMTFFECLSCVEDNVITAKTAQELSEKPRVCQKCGVPHREAGSDGEEADF
ncbi:hypothetical protein AB4Y45_33400 [Paraburkholderia sp. EG287A]|uniref:hypothetical protein n=1 Tax=Paraburkholderia sp. EG287A TaxID=3237012 RepID=UPI0034D1BF54